MRRAEAQKVSDWPRRKAEILEEYREQAKRQQDAYQQPDFWTALREKIARFDPSKPVNWAEYGYKRDATGKWYIPQKVV